MTHHLFKKISKGKSIAQIADESEESVDTASGLIKEIKG